MNSDDLQYLREQQRKFEDYAEGYRKETNEVFRELVRQLILVATVFLSFSAFIFYSKDLISKFSISDKHLLIISWIFIGVSIIFGIVQFFIDYYYFKQWTRAKLKIVDAICKSATNNENIPEIINNLPKIAEDAQKDIPTESSSEVFVWLQTISLIIGVILLVITMIKALFFTW
ncbi:MAG: hypothetical protein ABIK31_07920 [candidate division WOR-3 bacterium]